MWGGVGMDMACRGDGQGHGKGTDMGMGVDMGVVMRWAGCEHKH